MLGGEFSEVHGECRAHLARLDSDGALDASFTNGCAGADGAVGALALYSDGRALIGGGFDSINTIHRGGIARLDADGSLDTSFLDGLTGANGTVSVVVLQPDGRVLIGGSFTMVHEVGRNRIARLNADGGLDTTFLGRAIRLRLTPLSLDTSFLDDLSGANLDVYAMGVQPDGRVLIGGGFYEVNDVSRSRIARLNADGSLDTSFMAVDEGANAPVTAIALQPDGRWLVGGDFTSIHGVDRGGLARLNADGSLDTSFLDGLEGLWDADALALQPDGRVWVAGGFSYVNRTNRSDVARLHGEEPIVPSITVQPSGQTSYDGCCAVFHVEAAGTPRDYRWRKDGVDLEDGGSIYGARSDTLRLSGIGAADAGAYSVVVSNVLGEETSDDASLTVSPVPQCQYATCDLELGCVLADAPDGQACDDGNACTGTDSCLAGACQGTDCICSVVFSETVYAGAGDLHWTTPQDVRWVRGDLAGVGSYAATADGTLYGATALDISGDLPAAGAGLYWLVRPLGCGSWQSSAGAEPGRDASLP